MENPRQQNEQNWSRLTSGSPQRPDEKTKAAEGGQTILEREIGQSDGSSRRSARQKRERLHAWLTTLRLANLTFCGLTSQIYLSYLFYVRFL